jgi:hypothetical protein
MTVIKKEGYSTGLKHRVITKMNEYKNLERNFEYPLQIYINLELVFLKHANFIDVGQQGNSDGIATMLRAGCRSIVGRGERLLSSPKCP